MDIQAIRKYNFSLLVEEFGNKSTMAVALGVAPSYITQLLKPVDEQVLRDGGKKTWRDLSDKTCRDLEQKYKLPLYWMDVQRDSIGGVEISSDYDVKVAVYQGMSGQGQAIDSGGDVPSTPVKQSFIDSRKLDKDKLITVYCSIPNMGDEYQVGDEIMVDQRFEPPFKHGSAYAFKDAAGVAIIYRVLNLQSGAIVLRSKNSDDFPDQVIKKDSIDDVDVMGSIVRVVRST